MKNITYIVLIGIMLLLNISCHEEFLSEEPYSFIGPENFYNNADELEMAANATYLYRDGSYYTRNYMTYLSELVGPALTNKNGTSNSQNKYDWWNYNSSAPELAHMWTIFYRGINWCNAVITNGPSVKDDWEEPTGYNKVDRIIAEARFHRALIYKYISDYWGDVPLRTEEVTSLDNLAIARSPISEVRQVIIDDLKYAESKLPQFTEYSGDNIGRVCKAAAQALLAKVYLSMGQYADAKTYCDKIIDAGVHGLAPKFTDLWYYTNPSGSEDYAALNYEIIYDSQHSHSVGSYGGTSSRFTAPRNSSIAKNQFTAYAGEYWFIKSFEEGDDRLDGTFLMEYKIIADHEGHLEGETVRFDPDSIPTDGYYEDGPAVSKFIDPNGTYDKHEEPNTVALRYADVLMMKAEALNELGQTAEAIELVNVIRRRAFSLDPYTAAPEVDLTAGSVENFRKQLYIERLKEFTFETWGFDDLKRFWDVATPIVEESSKMEIIQKNVEGEDTEVLSANPKEEITASDKYKVFPIPATMMDSNPELTQNPGWD